MFVTKDQLEKKTGPNGIGRLSHLQSIVNEFQQTTSTEAKLQILANLANFAYDPINYNYLKVLNVVDLFLDCLLEDDDQMILFAMGGLCNLTIDDGIKKEILRDDELRLIINCLSRDNVEIVVSCLTAMYYMVPLPVSISKDVKSMVFVLVGKFMQHEDKRITNLVSLLMPLLQGE